MWAGESGGDWSTDREIPNEHTPIDRLATALATFEDAKREILSAYRDVTAWGGTLTTTGYSQSEWLTLVGRLPGRDGWKFDLLVSRLPALPVTAALMESGQLTIDQAVSIASGTKRINGDLLGEVEREAAHVALSRNERGDGPDMDADVDAIVQSRKKAADQDRLDRDRLERNSVRIQPDLWGAGRIVEDWADPEGFQTRVAGLEHAAGQPSPDVPRGQQLAEGSLAMSRAWLTGHRPTDTGTDAAAAGCTSPAQPPQTAPTCGDATETAPTSDPSAETGGTSSREPATGCTSKAHTPQTAPTSGSRPETAPTSGDDQQGSDRPDGDVNTATLDAIDNPDLPGPELGAARPTFVVRIDIADLEGFDRSDPDALRHLATGSNAAMGRLAARGRLSSTPWLGRQLLDTLACNVDLLVSVVDGERSLAEFRHTRRLPDRIRRQVLWRDMGCRWPSCRAPVAHCDVHHLDENPTNHDVDNLLTLCLRHHRRLHSVFWHPYLDGRTGRFELRRSPDGHAVHTTYPRGTRPTAQPPPEVAPTR